MRLLWMYLSAFLILPIIGEYVVLVTNKELTAGSVSIDLILHNTIFVVVLLITAFFMQNYKSTKNKITEIFNYQYAKNIFRRSIILLVIITLIIFILGGYQIIFGLADRGSLRITLGIFGPLYTVVLKYLPIAIFVFVSVVYIHLNKQNKKIFQKKLIFIYSFAIIIGFLSGYKAVAVMLVIPGLTVLYFNNFSIAKIFLFIFSAIVLLTLFTSSVREVGIQEAFMFLVHRATVMTAYGTIGVWNEASNGISLADGFINFLGAFGQTLSSYLLGIPSNDPEFLKTNLSRLITYKIYPDTERALSGAVNVTVTNFGHALYILGKNLYVYYAFIMGIIIGLIIRLYKKYIIKGYPLKASLIALYFFAVILPSINSGGIFMLFSLPVFIYFVLIYFVLKYLIRGDLRIV